MKKPKRKIKKYSAAEKKALGLDKVPETMYDLRFPRETASSYPEYEPVKTKEIDFND